MTQTNTPDPPAPGRAILLNGPSSAGKSSIAEALQAALLPEAFLHFPMDAFLEMIPAGKKAAEFPSLKFAMIESMQALLRHGHNLVIDVVCMPPTMIHLKNALASFDVFTVGVTASPEKLIGREIARGNRAIGLATSQREAVHNGVDYDMAIDTTATTPEEAADAVLILYSSLKKNPAPKTPDVTAARSPRAARRPDAG